MNRKIEITEASPSVAPENRQVRVETFTQKSEFEWVTIAQLKADIDKMEKSIITMKNEFDFELSEYQKRIDDKKALLGEVEGSLNNAVNAV